MDKHRKKILHLVEDLKVGGLERVLESIVLSLDKSKYDVHVWCLVEGGEIAEELKEKGMPVRIIGKRSYYNLSNILLLAYLVRRENFHIIHTHGYFASTFGRLAAILAGVPVMITHVHSTYYEYGKRNLMIERFLSFFTDNVICVSKAVQRFVVEKEGIRESRTSVIYNGISFPWNGLSSEDRKAKRASVSVSSQDVVIIEVASLTANKGHHFLLNAFQQIYKKNPTIKLIIVGDGPLQSTIQEEAKKLGMESAVIFTGQRKDVYELLAMSDIFILPSMIREGLSIAMIEAMAMGLPVIGSNVGGIPELIEDRVSGFLVSPGDTDQLARIIDLLATEQDLRKRLGQQGKRIYEEKFTLPRMVQQIEALYDHLLERKGIAAKA